MHCSSSSALIAGNLHSNCFCFNLPNYVAKMYLWLFFHFMFEPAWHCLYYKDKTRASKSSLAIFSFATNSWAPRSFSCREHPAQIRLTAPGSVLDKILSQGPTSDIFCGLMGFCTHCPYETTEGQTRGRGAAIQDQHQRISTSCKCATAIQSWPTREVKLFLWFLGTRIISPLTRERPGASFWEPV